MNKPLGGGILCGCFSIYFICVGRTVQCILGLPSFRLRVFFFEKCVSKAVISCTKMHYLLDCVQQSLKNSNTASLSLEGVR